MLDKLYQRSNHITRTLILNAYAMTLNIERYGKKYEQIYSEFLANSKMTYGELKEYQREKLIKLVDHAYNHVPYYYNVMNERRLKPQDIRELDDIVKLPILTRNDIKNNYKLLRADNIIGFKIRHGHTSGTTGSPLEFLWDTDVCVAHHAADWRQKSWAGLKFGDPFITLQGRQIVPLDRMSPPYWVMNYVHNQLFMSSFHLRDECIDKYIEKIDEYKPVAIEGYPSSLYIIARYLEKISKKVKVPVVLTSSETLLPLQRELIEDRFNCELFDFYGMSERVVYGAECKEHIGKHLNMDYGVTEILDNNDEPVSPGTYGRIVSTGIWNYAMPLIRYKTSDMSSIKTANCSCGVKFPLMDDVTTKSEDIIILRDGRLIPPSIMTHPFKKMKNILMSQIIQDTLDDITVYLTVDTNYRHDDTVILKRELVERVGTGVSIKIVITDKLEQSATGKYRWIISKVNK